jgi:hypothetical protein
MKYIIAMLLVVGCGYESTFRASAPLVCSVEEVVGGSLIVCPGGTSQFVSNGSDGVDGLNGQDGVDGQDGQDGEDGEDGEDGADGTVVTVHQFCPASHVPSYPSTFPEVGMCIGNKMYGVYSANGGFLVFMPPGTYSSNGINSSCTFTLQANCVIAR